MAPRTLVPFAAAALAVACATTPFVGPPVAPGTTSPRTTGAPEPPAPSTTSAPSAAPSATAAPAASAAPSTAEVAPTGSAPAPLADPPPYPAAWIRDAERDNAQLSCMELVYKRECAERRVGVVVVDVTLSPTGKVTRVEAVSNSVWREPEVVWRCLRQKLPKWKVHPPDGVAPSFRLSILFADAC